MGWGSIEDLQVPMLECQQCGHDVISSHREALVAIYLQVQRLHARWTKTSWAHTARSLSLAFY